MDNLFSNSLLGVCFILIAFALLPITVALSIFNDFVFTPLRNLFIRL